MAEHRGAWEGPVVVLDHALIIPLPMQNPDKDHLTWLNVDAGYGELQLAVGAYICAYPGDRAGLHAALDRWLDENGCA